MDPDGASTDIIEGSWPKRGVRGIPARGPVGDEKEHLKC